MAIPGCPPRSLSRRCRRCGEAVGLALVAEAVTVEAAKMRPEGKNHAAHHRNSLPPVADDLQSLDSVRRRCWGILAGHARSSPEIVPATGNEYHVPSSHE